jgi:hypothetical protein
MIMYFTIAPLGLAPSPCLSLETSEPASHPGQHAVRAAFHNPPFEVIDAATVERCDTGVVTDLSF